MDLNIVVVSGELVRGPDHYMDSTRGYPFAEIEIRTRAQGSETVCVTVPNNIDLSTLEIGQRVWVAGFAAMMYDPPRPKYLEIRAMDVQAAPVKEDDDG